MGSVTGRWAAGLVAAQLCLGHDVRALQTTVGGRQVDVDATLSVREVIEEDRATKHDRTQELLRLRLAVLLASWLRFDSTTVASNGGPTMAADRSGIYTWDDAFQDRSPSVDFEEAYLDVFLPSVDLRLGKQKVAWGKLDRSQPNDLLNPLSYLDPLLLDEAERKIGVPAVQASAYLPASWGVPEESRITAVWVPRYVPYRFPIASCDVRGDVSRCDLERWFPPAAVPDNTFAVPAGIIDLNGVTNPAFAVPVGFHTRNASPPAFRLENSEIGLRYAALVREADVALYYFHGFDPQPAFRLTAEATGQRDLDPTNPLHIQRLAAATTLTPDFEQIDAWGADIAYPFDRFTVRGEGAFVRGRPFSRDLRFLVTDPRSVAPEIAKALRALAGGAGRVDVGLPPSTVVRDAVEWGIGADYTYEGYVVLLQVNQTDVLHNDVELLIKDVETRLLANLRTNFLNDTVQTQLIAVHAIESDYSVLRPRLRYRVTDYLTVELGYLFIAGRARSVGGQFRRNDQGWVRLEYRL